MPSDLVGTRSGTADRQPTQPSSFWSGYMETRWEEVYSKHRFQGPHYHCALRSIYNASKVDCAVIKCTPFGRILTRKMARWQSWKESFKLTVDRHIFPCQTNRVATKWSFPQNLWKYLAQTPERDLAILFLRGMESSICYGQSRARGTGYQMH